MASFVPIRAFYCFDPTDRALCESLDRHLAPLKHADRLQTWDDRYILGGQEWEREYDQQFSNARLLILLVSSKFLASERGLRYLQMALDRQQAGEATVVPILVRPCLWEQTALSTVQMLPRDHCALAQQANRDATWTEIVQEISRVLASLHRLIYLIYAPEDHERGARLSQDLIRAGATPWHVEGDHLSPDLLLEREAMRQASSVLFVASPAALSSRVVRDQKDLADVYKRPIQLVWMRDEGDEWETGGIWQQEARFAAPAVNDAMTSEMLLTRLPQVLETVPEQEQPPQPVTEPRNPYKGLHPFTAEDTRDFFGREALIDELATTVEHLLGQEQKGQPTGRLLTVLGASGSGKSSVVLAGLLPHLKRGDISGSGQWLYLDPIVPGAHPLEALALSLAQQSSLGNASSLHHELMADSLRTLHLLTRQLVGSSSPYVVLFIDQFEEVFAATVSEEERQHFFDLLITAATEPEGALLVMVTMRADFSDRAMLYPAFYRLLDAQHVSVFPMERDDLRRVIEEPARLPEVQMTFEGDLVGDLLFELRGQVGALPLLEFTLDQLFAARSGRMFTLSAYREMGGVKGALAKRAQATYDVLPTKEHQELARNLFLRLVDPGQSEHDTTRRRARLSEFELPDPAQTRLLREAMGTFLDARLLTSNEQAGVATIEVSHEALIRQWPRLIEWLREARQDILLQQKMSEDAGEWQLRRYPNDRLYRGSQLKEAQMWARRNPLSQYEATFLRAGTRRRRQLLLNIVAFALVLMILVGGTVWSYIQFQQAQAQIHDPTLITTLRNDDIGSLRWAIDNAPSGKTITFASSLAGRTITLTSTLFITKKRLSIQGPQRKITLSATYGIEVDVGAAIVINNVIVTGSRANSTSLFTNQGNLSLMNSNISGNNAFNGGGIYNINGTLNLMNSTISGNTSLSALTGGGIHNLIGTVNIINSNISGNTSFDGGGIFNQNGTLNIMNSNISNNTAKYGSGGGVFNLEGTLNIMNSNISNNTAKYGGGGIYNEHDANIMNSTIAGNTAYNDNGGGVDNDLGTAILTFCTIYYNHARIGGGLSKVLNKHDQNIGASIMLNSFVAGNQASQGPNIAGNLITNGYNLIQDTKGSVILDPKHTHHTDLINIPPSEVKVDPDLQLNRSTTTKTHALLPGSLAIDAIPPAACLITIMGVPITTDQRGIKRPQGSACDIGAYEYAP